MIVIRMPSESSPLRLMNGTTNRREFLAQAAAATTVAGWAGTTIIAASSESAPTSVLPAGTGRSARGKSSIALAPPDKQPPDLKLPTIVGRKIGYAIVGLGELALSEILPAFKETQYSKPVALVSGHADKARKVAEAYDISPDAIYNYDNYDSISGDKRVDVIYIVLPNSMHADFTIRGLRAGKHVLCEKPMAASVEEAQRMIDAAKDARKKLMIGYRLHYEPFNRKVIHMCKEKELGQIKVFASSNCQNVKAPNIRLSRDLAGGPLGDVGIYSINAARYVIGEEPVEVTAMAFQPSDDPRFEEVPESVAFTVYYPSGVVASCDCSFGTAESRRYRVHCTEGLIDLDPAFHYRELRLLTHTGNADKGDTKVSEHLLTAVNHFAAEMDHFSSCVLDGSDPHTPGEMGLADMRIMAAINQAISTGQRTRVT